jgi:hypothetical protein
MIIRRRVFFGLIGAGAMGTIVFAGLGKPVGVANAEATTSGSKQMAVTATKTKLRKGPCWLA